MTESLHTDFENNKIIILEGIVPENLEFFLDHPSAEFPDWVPPVMDHKILKPVIDSNHPFWPFCPNREGIVDFQKKMIPFQKSWEAIHKKLFSYKYEAEYWSWRFNKMDLGFLHLDIPPTNYPEHQMRSFMNLSRRPRILQIGPTTESLIKKFYDKEELGNMNLNNSDYLKELKKRLFNDKGFEDFYLPPSYFKSGSRSYLDQSLLFDNPRNNLWRKNGLL